MDPSRSISQPSASSAAPQASSSSASTTATPSLRRSSRSVAQKQQPAPAPAPSKPKPSRGLSTPARRGSSSLALSTAATEHQSDSSFDQSFGDESLSAPLTPATTVSSVSARSSKRVREESATAAPSSASTGSRQKNARTSVSSASTPAVPAATTSSKGKGKRRASPSPPPPPTRTPAAGSSSASTSQPAPKKARTARSQAPSYNLRPRSSAGTTDGSPSHSRSMSGRKGGASGAAGASSATASASTSARGNGAAGGPVAKGKARPSRSTRTASSSQQHKRDEWECASSDHMDVDDAASGSKADTAKAIDGSATSDAALSPSVDDGRASSALGPATETGSVGTSEGRRAYDDDDDDEDDDEEHDEGDEDGSQGVRDEDQMHPDEDDDEGAYDDDEMDDPYGDGGDGAGVYGLNLRAMAGYMSGLSSRFRTLLTGIKDRKDPTAQLVALQELSEVLSISNEDTLAGYFPTESFVKELIYIMGGPKPVEPKPARGIKREDGTEGEGDKDDDEHAADEDDEDELTAAAIAAAAGLEDNGETMMLACRCLANLIEAMPYAAHSIISFGAVPVLCAKLQEIQFIDLAEQVLQTLEKLSAEYPGPIVRDGGLMAMLQYLDFFGIHVQRTAMTAASNCCRKLYPDAFAKVAEVMPIVQNVLGYSDQRLVESACRCVIRAVDSYKHYPDLLEKLLTDPLVASVNGILLPGSPSSGNTSGSGSAGAGTTAGTGSNAAGTTISASVYTDVLKALSTAAKASPRVAVTLLENNVVETLYVLLTGSAAPPEGQAPATTSVKPEADAATASAESVPTAVVGEGDGVAVADVAILQNLANRPKEQVQEALSLVGELLPPLPRDGVFDARAYSEKAYTKRKHREARSARKSAANAGGSGTSDTKESDSGDAASAKPSSSAVTAGPSASPDTSMATVAPPKSEREQLKEAAQAKRIETLRERKSLVKRFTQLVLPTLVEVYAASVALHVRSKALTGILKIISFVEPEPLNEVLDNVQLASFIAAILSSRDHPTLVQGAMQMVELLTIKLPNVYSALLRREGVMWEVEDIASRTPTTSAKPSSSSPAKPKAGSSSSGIVLPGNAAASASTSSGAAATGTGEEVSSSDRDAAAAALAETTSRVERLLGISNPLSGLGAGGLPSRAATTSASATAKTTAEQEDANIWRARVLRDRFAAENADEDQHVGADAAVKALDHIKALVARLSEAELRDEESARSTLQDIARLFSRSDNPISSFELLRSGLVDGLYAFSTTSSEALSRERRRSLLTDTLMARDADSGTTAATVLVRRLQETLSRLENVEIATTINSGPEDSRRSLTANVARQLRLKLVAEGAQPGEIPRSCTNVVVSIHAIASFQSLNDYLRPKIAAASRDPAASGGASATASRLQNVLAAFASSAGLELPSASARAAALASATAAASSNSSGSKAPASGSNAEASSSKPKSEDSSSSSSRRRRSSRLSGKEAEEGEADKKEEKADEDEQEGNGKAKAEQKGEGEGDAAAAAASAEHEDMDAEEALARQLVEGLMGGGMDEDDDGFDDEVFDDELEGPDAFGSAEDKTITLSVEQDGSKVEAKTPDGTHVPTPTHETASASSSKAAETSASAGSSKGADAGSSTAAAAGSSSSPATGTKSYAAALQKKATDWHLEFEMGGQPVHLDSTIYGAIHRFESAEPQRASSSQRYIWHNVYTVKFRKVAGPEPASDARATASPEPDAGEAAGDVALPESIPKEAPFARILQLLGVLHDINAEWRELRPANTAAALDDSRAGALGEAAFVNNKLTAKLNRQLEEPMIVASACLPGWSTDLPRSFPFLFPFEARYSFLQSTSFGYHRLINRWQTQQSRSQDSVSSRHDDSLALLGRLSRQKVRIQRQNILASAVKVFELYGSSQSLLEVEYFDEVGTGLGPTLEFYALVSKEIAKKAHGMWRDEAPENGEYAIAPHGLFPAAMSSKTAGSATGKQRLTYFAMLGQLVAKALFDSRIVDVHFSPTFMRMVLGQRVPQTMATLASVDPAMARSLEQLQQLKGDEIDSLGIDFTLPGHSDYELRPGGADESVTRDNIDEYVDLVIDHSLARGVREQVRAFRRGFSLIFPITAMRTFTPDELVMLFGNAQEDWTEATIMSTVKPGNGYTFSSPPFRHFVELISSYDAVQRRRLLQWMTGSPRLPIGGFGALTPPLTVVKRITDSGPDDSALPTIMSCQNYLKLPPYSSQEVLAERLNLAIREGSMSFHLS